MKHSLLFLSLPLFLLSSCGPSNGGTDEKFMTKNVETLIDNMNNKDVDAIYETFSNNRKNAIPTLKDDIKSLCDYYQGGKLKKWIKYGGSGSKTYYENHKKRLTIHDSFQVECENQSYTIAISWRRYDSWEKDNIGLWLIEMSEYEEGVNWPNKDTKITVGEEEKSTSENQ